MKKLIVILVLLCATTALADGTSNLWNKDAPFNRSDWAPTPYTSPIHGLEPMQLK